MGIEIRRPHFYSGFRFLFHKVEVVALCPANNHWTKAQIPGRAAGNYQLVCRNDLGRLDRAYGWGWLGSYCPGDVFSAGFGMAIIKAYYATEGNHEPVVLKTLLKSLLGKLDLEVFLIQPLEAFSE